MEPLNFVICQNKVRVRKKPSKQSHTVYQLQKGDTVQAKFIVGINVHIVKPEGWINIWNEFGSIIKPTQHGKYGLNELRLWYISPKEKGIPVRTKTGKVIHTLPSESIVCLARRPYYERLCPKKNIPILITFPVKGFIKINEFTASRTNRFNHNLLNVWYMLEQITRDVIVADLILLFVESSECCYNCEKRFFGGQFCPVCNQMVCDLCVVCNQDNVPAACQACQWCFP